MNTNFQLPAASCMRQGVRRVFLWMRVLSCLLLCGGTRLTRAAPAPPAQTLPNGMRVLVRERHATALVAIDLWVRAGSREENPEETGSAHFLEHTLFKGTSRRSAGQADRDIENLGATLNAATGPDYAHYYTAVAAPHALQALHILADVVCNATLPDAEVERERGVILDELAQHDSDPHARMVDLLYARSFALQPYGHSPGGTADAIRLRGRDTLAAFYRRTYQPARCALVLVGDVTPDQARQWAERAFGGWNKDAADKRVSSEAAEAGRSDTRITQSDSSVPVFAGQRTPFEQPPAFQPIPILPSRPVFETGTRTRACVALAFPAPPAGNAADTTAALLTAEILGNGRNGGRLATMMARIEAEAHFTPRRDFSLWLLLASFDSGTGAASRLPDRMGRRPLLDSRAQPESGQEDGRIAERSLRAAVDSLRASPLSALELSSAQRRLLAQWESEQETNAGLAQAVGYAELTGGEPPEALAQRVLLTTPADIQRFLTRYVFSQPGLAVHLLAPSAEAQETMRESRP